VDAFRTSVAASAIFWQQRARGVDVTGIEFNPSAVRFAQQHYPLQNVFALRPEEFRAAHPQERFDAVSSSRSSNTRRTRESSSAWRRIFWRLMVSFMNPEEARQAMKRVSHDARHRIAAQLVRGKKHGDGPVCVAAAALSAFAGLHGPVSVLPRSEAILRRTNTSGKSANCRRVALEEYELTLQGWRYKQLYEDLLRDGTGNSAAG
jgi:hypothetical protein